jgi:hypothetical protein
MKKVVVITAFLLFSGLVAGQTIQKGAVLAVSVSIITPDPDVTLNQYLDFFKNKWAPAVEKNFPGTKVFLIKGDRGKHANENGWIWYFESQEVRDTYFDAEGNMRESASDAFEKLGPIMEELNKLGTSEREYTDWIIL